MEDFAYFSDTFNVAKTTTYKLSLLLRQDGIMYTIVDEVRNKCIAIKNTNFTLSDDVNEYHKQIKSFIDKDTFLSKTYKRTNFVFSSSKSTLIPFEFFNKNMLKTYYTLNLEMNDYEEIHFNKLADIKVVNVFSIPSVITTLMVNKFPELRFYHQSSTMIDGLIRKSKERGLVVGILLCRTHFYVIVAKDGKLLLFNNLKFSTDTDFVYHVMNIYKQLDIPNRESNMYLFGNITKESHAFELLSEYVSNIWFSKTISERPMIYNFKEVPEHVVSNLLSVT